MKEEPIELKKHRVYAYVNLGAIEKNLEEIKATLPSGASTMAIIKADAYGHGAVPIAKHIESQVDAFAVASADEARALRSCDIQKPILILSYTSPLLFNECICLNLTTTIYNYNDAKRLSDAAKRARKTAKIHVAIDTGMGRIGFSPTESSADEVQIISRLDGIFVEGIFTHFACADDRNASENSEQLKQFEGFISMLNKRSVCIPQKHICNSAASLFGVRGYDLYRLGIAMYGLYPSSDAAAEHVRLTPAMEVVCHVIHIKDVPQGTKIGYSHTYVAKTQRRIATLSIGYADGLRRCLSNVGYVLINGKRAPIVGLISMDMTMVDVTDIDGVQIGDPAVVMGKYRNEIITAELLGDLSYSFNYEVVCGFSHRVKRIYHINGTLL